MLVGDDVVGVVGAGPLELERPQCLAFDREARDRPSASVRMVRGFVEQRLEEMPIHGDSLRSPDLDEGRGVDGEVSRTKVDDVRLGNVVPDGVKEILPDDFRRRRKVRMGCGVELHEESSPGGVPHGEPRGDARGFSCDDRQRKLRSSRSRRPSSELFEAHVADSDAVLEPARVGDLSQSIDVHRPRNFDVRVHGRERVQEKVVRRGEIDCAGLVDWKIVPVHENRVVRIELPAFDRGQSEKEKERAHG
jgi:hypothetical protein